MYHTAYVLACNLAGSCISCFIFSDLDLKYKCRVAMLISKLVWTRYKSMGRKARLVI